MKIGIGNPQDESGDTAIAVYISSDLQALDFDHPAWQASVPIHITRYWSGTPAPADRQAEARIVWTPEALCVRFVCQQREPLVIAANPQTQKKTVGLWNRDVCEIFIATNPRQPQHYFEFEAAPTGEWLDLALQWTGAKRETDWEFHSGMTVAARIAEDHVRIAMRIPWGEWLHKPHTGERWRANLFRCIGQGKERGYLAWQPTHTAQPTFHVPEVFACLNFT